MKTWQTPQIHEPFGKLEACWVQAEEAELAGALA